MGVELLGVRLSGLRLQDFAHYGFKAFPDCETGGPGSFFSVSKSIEAKRGCSKLWARREKFTTYNISTSESTLTGPKPDIAHLDPRTQKASRNPIISEERDLNPLYPLEQPPKPESSKQP